MHKSNLFKRIEHCEGENFATEILAFILSNDDGIKNAFLDLLLKRQSDLREAFRPCGIETQQSFGFERPDMTITPASNRGTRVFVEIKTQAQVPETRSPDGDGQVKRYLKYGHVAYLTPRGHDEPDLGGADDRKYQYLGHFYWDQVYSVIQDRGSVGVLHKQFLGYLEARNMAPLKPISEDDLRQSLHAAEIIRKFWELVDAFRKEIEPDCVREFGANIGAKRALWGVETGYLPHWWFRPRDWEGGLYLSAGAFAKKGAQDRPGFYVGLYTDQKKFGRELKDSRELRARCDDMGWVWDDAVTPEYWGYYKAFPLGTGKIEDLAGEQVNNIRSEEKSIRELVEFAGKMR